MAGKELKDSLDAVVEKVVKKLDKKTFLECLPQEADQALLNSLHDRFVTVVRRKMMENVEEHMAERQVLAKLEELRQLVSKTTHPITHQAWRPSGLPADALAAGDLAVAEREVEELRLLEQELDTEVEQLEERLEAMGRREEGNRAALDRREERLAGLAEKLGAGAV